MPVHPGEILLEQYLGPAGIDRQLVADEIGLSVKHIDEIIAGARGISADTALRLARYFGTAPEFWLHLQNQYDLEVAQQAIALELMVIDPFHPEQG